MNTDNIAMAKSISKYFNEDTAIVCIGSVNCPRDKLGPLTGSFLKSKNFSFPVYGTLENPIHALNMTTQLSSIQKKHKNINLIGIDACLGYKEDFGKIKFKQRPLYPGNGVGKNLNSIGKISIVGILDSFDHSKDFYKRDIDKTFMENMSNNLVDILLKAFKFYKKRS